ncbi:hypothetical protein HELRODRAFT_185820 [Helobdella robusta]|uniref:Fatty acid hydroxylase domain-containing protein n=1 Tax=Helobdella robusta TaxID=6412 RepID=T1FNC0_HELRO|nr:hypothetical protein HELRODRAFT_185820 [Helobdella robusta]ESN99625.1 hypothetical protein HELRODRAFT_185820 [Helobdella robusta]
MMMAETTNPTKNEKLDKVQIKKTLFEKIKQLWELIRLSVFVIGTALVVFIAARNSVTWYLQQFWGASGSYWQSKWEVIHDFFGGNDMLLGFTGLFLVANGVFCIINSFFAYLDITGHPSFLLKYKIQQDKNKPVDVGKLMKAVKQVAFNQVVVGGPFMYVMFKVMICRGCSFGRELPTFHWVAAELVVFTIVEEIMFYYSHRLFHAPFFYRRIHKIHHEWVSPVGVTSIYAHPIEHIFANMLPIIMGPIVMKSHIATAIMWCTIGLASTSISHCGYHLPFLFSPEAHDFHHLKFVDNFGMLGVLDRLHGTDKYFRASKAYQRHMVLLGLVPLSVQFPDDEKKVVESEKINKACSSETSIDEGNEILFTIVNLFD